VRDLYTWMAITAVVLASVAGDVMLSRAMKGIGDLGALRRQGGLRFVLVRVLTTRSFLIGLTCMAVAFYSLLLALSWADVSLVGPASASLTFIGNAVAARTFLRERVDGRRWVAVLLVALGVALVAI
jgi:drug/metabolite transporter (DMT)-like permease